MVRKIPNWSPWGRSRGRLTDRTSSGEKRKSQWRVTEITKLRMERKKIKKGLVVVEISSGVINVSSSLFLDCLIISVSVCDMSESRKKVPSRYGRLLSLFSYVYWARSPLFLFTINLCVPVSVWTSGWLAYRCRQSCNFHYLEWNSWSKRASCCSSSYGELHFYSQSHLYEKLCLKNLKEFLLYTFFSMEILMLLLTISVHSRP